MKTWTYSWVIYPLVYALARLWGLFKPKVRDTLRLRSWKDYLSLRFNVGQPIEYWIHVASHGELEYAIPVLRELQSRGKRILITYYSISARKPVEGLPQQFSNVSLVVPLPHDGLGLMKEFVALARKQGVQRLLLMKYELWPGLLWECNRQGIKVVLVDALKPSWFHRRLLHKLDGILSGYESEIHAISHRNAKVVGDTRVERVLERVEQSENRLNEVVSPTLREILRTRPVLVCGSMWPPDSNLVLQGLESSGALPSGGSGACHLIWVPHELDSAESERVSIEFKRLGYAVADFDEAGRVGANLSGQSLAIIVMKKGILAELYRLGQAAFVGGGFGSGVHSVWEPALTGAYVACGPRTERSPESTELQNCGMLERVRESAEMATWIRTKLLMNQMPSSSRNGHRVIETVAKRHVGASKRIIQVCEEM